PSVHHTLRAALDSRARLSLERLLRRLALRRRWHRPGARALGGAAPHRPGTESRTAPGARRRSAARGVSARDPVRPAQRLAIVGGGAPHPCDRDRSTGAALL